MELVICPECDSVADIEWRDPVVTTSGPRSLVKVRCIQRHWFLMLADGVAALPTYPLDAA